VSQTLCVGSQKPVVWLFWTISPERMGGMIWLGAYFYVEILYHTSSLFLSLWVFFWVYLGLSKWPKDGKKKEKHKKPVFWWFWTFLKKKNRHNDFL
jgi:hypothetical protein